MLAYIQKGKILLKMAVCLLAGGVVGTLLLTLVYCIPADRIYAGYQSVGLESIQRREGWHRYLVDYDASTLDNNTECLMLKAAATPLPDTGENILQKALRCYTLNAEWNHGMTFQQYEWKGEQLSCDSYERYWHGYLIILKPLLAICTYTDLIYLNLACQALIIFGILYVLISRRKRYLAAAFLLFWIVGMQNIIGMSLDYSVCFYIYSAAVLVLLRHPAVMKKYVYYFLVIGMLTSYMDLLTWPLVTLAVPLLVSVQAGCEETPGVGRIMAASLAWGAGYAGMWALKWIIASLLLDGNVLADAAGQFMLRSALGTAAEEVQDVSWFEVLRTNLAVLWHGAGAVVMLAAAVWLLAAVIRYRKELNWRAVMPCLLTALLPLGWYLITRNHSYEHYWMTWRNLAISVFALCCIPGSARRE